MEVGTRIARLGDGDLRLYGGLLYYTGEEVKPVFGTRARLEARPTNNISVGLAIQQDPLFDTSVILDLGNVNNTSYNLQNNSGTFQLLNRDTITTRNTGAFDFKPSVANFTNVNMCQ